MTFSLKCRWCKTSWPYLVQKVMAGNRPACGYGPVPPRPRNNGFAPVLFQAVRAGPDRQKGKKARQKA
jgi:hypothetical protein